MGGGQSSIGSAIGDIFYPSNPDRRRRAEQLKSDIENYVSQFNEKKKKIDALEPVIRARIDAYLKQHNFETLGDLIKKNDATLTGDALEDWNKLKASLNTEHFIDEFILTVSGLIAAGTGIVVGALVLFGVMSGPVGWAIFAGVGEIMGLIAAVGAIMAIIDASKERDSLRDAINKLYYTRIDTLQTLRKLDVYQNWVIEFSDFFKDEWVDLSPDIFEKKFGQGFRDDAHKYDRNTIIAELQHHDDDVQAWTDEDPEHPPRINPSFMMLASAVVLTEVPMEIKPPIPAEGVLNVLLTHESGLEKTMSLQLQQVITATTCIVADDQAHEQFGVNILPRDPTKAIQSMADCTYSFTNLEKHDVLLGYTMKVLSVVG